MDVEESPQVGAERGHAVKLAVWIVEPPGILIQHRRIAAETERGDRGGPGGKFPFRLGRQPESAPFGMEIPIDAQSAVLGPAVARRSSRRSIRHAAAPRRSGSHSTDRLRPGRRAP